MPKRRYSIEFKEEAARLMIMDGLTAVEVSKQLGIHTTMLYRWKQEHLKKMEGTPRSAGQAGPEDMAAEIDRLRKQLAKSERINAILKKTVGYFAKED